MEEESSANDVSVSFNEALRVRTKEAALRIIRVFQRLLRTGEAQVLGKQLLRSATSVAANFRAACRGRSTAGALPQNGMRSFAPAWKKPMKPCFGLNYSAIQVS
jgi:hypothetical protein